MTMKTLNVNGSPVTLHEFTPRTRQQQITTQWIPGDAKTCDVWLYALPLAPDVWILEGEVSNASFAPGVPARQRVTCRVKIESTEEGYSMGHDLAQLPDHLDPQRARLFRVLISGPDAPADVSATVEAWEAVPIKDWNQRFGPLGMRMPTDRFADQGDELEYAYEHGGRCNHLDSRDAINVEGFRQFGGKAREEAGGTGIWFGYPYQDLRAVRVLAKTVTNRNLHAYDRRTGEPITVEYYGAVTPAYDKSAHWLPEFRDLELDEEWLEVEPSHGVRRNLYYWLLFSMTRSPLAERLVVHAGERARLMFSERGPVSFEPNWSPANVHQLHELALRDPHQGLNGLAGRWAGWIGMAWAWRVMARPRGASRAFGTTFLATFELGASLSHGFVQRDKRVMPIDPTNPAGPTQEVHDVAQVFELSMLGHAVLSIARVTGQPPPHWIQRAASTVYEFAAKHGWTMLYAGMPTPPHIVQWQSDGSLIPAPSTDADPAFGHFEELCAALYASTQNTNYLMMSCVYHVAAPNWNVKVAEMAAFPAVEDLRMCTEARGIGALKQ